MTSTQTRNRTRHILFLMAAVSATGLTLPALLTTAAYASPYQATAPATPGPGTRVSGTVTAIAANVLTVKDDKGNESKVTVPDTAKILQLPAGSKNLSAATPIKLQEIAIGDRILAKTTSSADNNGFSASTVLAMKQADVAQKQQHDREDWQTRGISGVVKSIDPAAQMVTVTTGSGAAAKSLAVQASSATVIRRYAPDSTKFDDAKTATLAQINVGDQLRAKGDKNADGTQIAAEDIVAGTFHNIAGTVVSVDAAANTVTVNDLATKKPFTVNVNADSQLHKLEPAMAQGMAARLKGGAGMGSARSGSTATQAAGAAPGATPPSGVVGHDAAGGPPSVAGGGTPGQRGGDLQQMLTRAPVLQLADLKKGDAVMILTTEGQTSGTATAITLLAGVEPLLQASPGASQSVLSASWNLGGGGAAAGQDAQ